jgi:hypothetical protein
MMKIILFEDDDKMASKISTAVQRCIPKGGKVIRFRPSGRQTTALYEDRLIGDLKGSIYAKPSLWVTDRDLSQTENYRGLSEAVISKVASAQGIPLCKYAQGTGDAEFERQREWGDAQIILDISDIAVMAHNIAVLASGFDQIARLLKKTLSHRSVKTATPAAVMASILGRPDATDRIALYASGDQKMVAEILPFATSKTARKVLEGRLPSLLGYWLYDSILRFPGLFVNSVAAASYLNIAVSEFGKPSIQRLFCDALYKGPFCDKRDPRWWRADLDRIVSKNEFEDGNAFARSKLGRKILPCLDHQKRAGWYCMVSKAPVSQDNSVGNISWFPPGADLARISKRIYEKAGPWLGLY